MSKKFKTPSSMSASASPPACVVAPPPVCVVAPACVVSPKREKSSEEKKGLRYFHVSHKKIDDGAYFGRYEGRSPKQAASKAFTALHGIMADKGMPNSGKIHYELQEITRGSARKVHYYVGERVELEKPIIRMIGCKEVPFRFINKIYVDKDASKNIEKPAKKPSKKPKSPKATTSPKKAKPAKPVKAPKSPKATTSPKKAKPAKPAKPIKSPKKTKSPKPSKSPKKTSKVVCKVVKA